MPEANYVQDSIETAIVQGWADGILVPLWNGETEEIESWGEAAKFDPDGKLSWPDEAEIAQN